MRLLVVSLLIVIVSACSSNNPVDVPAARTAVLQEAVPTINPSNERLASAQFNYQRNCAHCHGYAGEGQHPNSIERTIDLGYHLVPAHDATGHTWQHPDQLLFEVIKYGIENPLNLYTMTPFEEQLSDDEIFAVIDYMRLWWTDEQRAWQAQLTAQFTENNPNWTPTRFDE